MKYKKIEYIIEEKTYLFFSHNYHVIETFVTPLDNLQNALQKNISALHTIEAFKGLSVYIIQSPDIFLWAFWRLSNCMTNVSTFLVPILTKEVLSYFSFFIILLYFCRGLEKIIFGLSLDSLLD